MLSRFVSSFSSVVFPFPLFIISMVPNYIPTFWSYIPIVWLRGPVIIIIIIIHSLEFFTSALADGFHWSLSNIKSPHVSMTLLSILAVLNNAVVWMVSICPATSKSSSPFSNPLVTVPNAPITIGIIVTCMFHSFFNSLVKSRYLSFFSHSFSFILCSAGTAKSTILQVLFFFFCWLLWGLVFWLRLGDPCACQSPIGVYVSFSRIDAGLCIFHLFVWSNLNFLHISQWIPLPTQSCLVFASFSRMCSLMAFHRSFSNCQSLQVSRTLISILANLSNTCHLISNSSQPLTKPLGIVPSTPITFSITMTFRFHSFFRSLAKSKYFLFFLFVFFNFYSVFRRDTKVHYSAGSFLVNYLEVLSLCCV